MADRDQSRYVRYEVCVQQGFEQWDLGALYVPADATPAETKRHVVDLLRTVADDLEREQFEATSRRASDG